MTFLCLMYIEGLKILFSLHVICKVFYNVMHSHHVDKWGSNHSIPKMPNNSNSSNHWFWLRFKERSNERLDPNAVLNRLILKLIIRQSDIKANILVGKLVGK